MVALEPWFWGALTMTILLVFVGVVILFNCEEDSRAETVALVCIVLGMVAGWVTVAYGLPLVFTHLSALFS